MGRFYESNGMSRIAGRILALLLCLPSPLSAEQIASRLHVARSSVSTNIRLLLSRGAAEPVTFTGDRLTYYRFSWDTWQQTTRAMIARYGSVKTITNAALAALPATAPAYARIQEYNRWVDFFVERYQAILDNWPAGAAPKSAKGALK